MITFHATLVGVSCTFVRTSQCWEIFSLVTFMSDDNWHETVYFYYNRLQMNSLEGV